MIDVTVGGHTYRIGKLDAIKQLHVYRRILPILAGAGGLSGVAGLRAAAQETAADGVDEGQVLAFAGMLAPMLEILARMDDAEIDYIINACLSVVTRSQDGDRGWARIMSGGALMFDDIGLPQILELTGRVIIGAEGTGGIGDFFAGRLSPSGGAPSPSGA